MSKDLKKELLENSLNYLKLWLPNGKLEGKEYRVGSVRGETGRSLSVNVETGVWSDFAEEGVAGADLISLYAAIQKMDYKQAQSMLTPRKKLPDPKTPKKEIERKTYRYTDDYTVTRIDYSDGSKTFRQKYKGKPQTHPEPKPLFEAKPWDPTKMTVIVEGEKAALACQTLFDSHCNVVSWSCGGAAWKKTDFKRLSGTNVTLWPDADRPGVKNMKDLAEYLSTLNCNVNLINPFENNILPKIPGWDAVEALDYFDGNWPKFRAWVKKIIRRLNEFKDPFEISQTKPVREKALIKTPQSVSIDQIQSLELMSSDKGKILSNVSNVYKILSAVEQYKDCYYYDTFLGREMVRGKNKFRPIEDADAIELQMQLQQKFYMASVSKATIYDAIIAFSQKNQRAIRFLHLGRGLKN